MPTGFISGIQRCLAVFLTALLVLPPGEAFAFGHKKKKEQPTAASASSLTPDQRVLHALNRLTFGPRPEDVAAVEAIGLDKWIDEQLNPETIEDSAFEARLADYPAMRLSQHDLVERFPSNAMIRQAEQGKRGIPWGPVEHAIYTDQIAQLRERQQNKQQAAASRQQAGMQPTAANGEQNVSGSMAVSYTHLDVYKRQVLGLLGAMLAVTGIFGMASYVVTKRFRELGIRVALGAQQKQVLRAALGRAFVLLGAGSVLGIVLGVLAAKVLSFIVYQATPKDPVVLGGVVLSMLLLGLFAAWIPAQKALGVDPMILLREE